MTEKKKAKSKAAPKPKRKGKPTTATKGNERKNVTSDETRTKRTFKKKASRGSATGKAITRRRAAACAPVIPPAGSEPGDQSGLRRPADEMKAVAISRPGFPIVGIGASAGGLQAFEGVLPAHAHSPRMAFVLVSHLDPDHASILHELLGKSTALPVEQITDGAPIRVDHVYVGPPGVDVAILNGELQLMRPTKPHGARLPIDYWFRSLAQDQKEAAIGIVLSGNGSDGTLGLKAIKGESGMVMAQLPETARFTGMPCSAIATGLVDFVLPAARMPEQLLAYARGPYLMERELRFPAVIPASTDMQKIFVLLRARTGHDFSLYKPGTLRRRIARRMNIHQIKGYRQYVQYLQENPQEADLLFKELLIGVTSFFRDPGMFEALAEKALPRLLASKSAGTAVRVWVPVARRAKRHTPSPCSCARPWIV